MTHLYVIWRGLGSLVKADARLAMRDMAPGPDGGRTTPAAPGSAAVATKPPAPRFSGGGRYGGLRVVCGPWCCRLGKGRDAGFSADGWIKNATSIHRVRAGSYCLGSVLKISRAALTVAAMSSALWAALTNPASYKAGAMYTPRSSRPWNSALNWALLVVMTVA